MRRKARETVGWLAVVVLFFAYWGVAGAQTNESARLELDELRLVLGRMRAENQDLKMQAGQREAVIRKLQESLVLARTESELFQRKWTEAQLRAQTLGANPSDTEAETAHRQLAETVRRLYLANAERQQLASQLQRLVVAVQSNANIAAEVEATVALLAPTTNKSAAVSSKATALTGTLADAKIVDVNDQLRVVVLNIGAQQGVRIGMPFIVRRGDRSVAELRVIEVRAKICGALVEKWVALKAGDAVSVTRSGEGSPR